jgi:hypothetical protein
MASPSKLDRKKSALPLSPIEECHLWDADFFFFILPWRWRRYVPPKRRFIQYLHGATSKKTAFFKVTAVKISNITCYRNDFATWVLKTINTLVCPSLLWGHAKKSHKSTRSKSSPNCYASRAVCSSSQKTESVPSSRGYSSTKPHGITH